MISYPFKVPVIKVEQPLGQFFAASIPVEVLLQTTFSEKLFAEPTGDGTYFVDGAQRLTNQGRLNDIAKFINRDDSNFPNSIILAANYRQDGRFEGDSDDEAMEIDENARRWEITVEELTTKTGVRETYWLSIPSPGRVAAVIDGQHRLYAFVRAQPKHLTDELLCSVYMDLAKPLQAQVFAVINSTQKPVPKSMTYELFGYNVDDEEEKYWSPDKLAVLFTRRLAVDAASPVHDRIIVAPENSFASARRLRSEPWRVSFATFVAGIVHLFSSNPKRDADLLMTPRSTRAEGPGSRKDNTPLRSEYLQMNDQLIYAAVLNFVKACDAVFWRNAPSGSYIKKTVGVQALFDVARDLTREGLANEDLTQGFYEKRLSMAGHIPFDDERFLNPSGSGRSFIRKLLIANMRIRDVDGLTAEDRKAFIK